MKTIFALAAVAVLSSSPAFALETAAGSGTGGRLLSSVEFAQVPENHGMPQRVVDRRYEEYRQGRLPVTTLDASRIR